MKAIILRITLFSMFLYSLSPLPAFSTTEQRTALVIGNSAYSSGPLKNPVNDATDMAATLKRLGFNVILRKNATQQDMEDAIRELGDRLKKGGVGLFFYAGHGVQIGGQNYLLPIGVRIDRDTDVKYRAVDADMVLDEMGNAGNPMNIVILDACRDNPFVKNFRTASRGLAIISSAPRGTLISYSTGPGNIAADGAGRNSPYTGALMNHMMTPGLPIEEVFKNVRQDLGRQTKGKQIPWELSSLEGRFYFKPGSAAASAPGTGTPFVDYAAEQSKIEEERKLLRQKADLEEEKRKLEEERQQLAMAKRPPTPNVKENRRDGHFIAYDDGTVLDTKTNLMWAAIDSEKNINWQDARSYCENYRGGGYSDWRMPKQYELARLYDGTKQSTAGARITDLIQLTTTHGWTWAAETEGSRASAFNFSEGLTGEGIPQSYAQYRALPVRTVKGNAEVAMIERPLVSTAKEIKRDGRFIAYDNGTVLDMKTNLIWAAKDNSSDINWQNAKNYCENYRGGGYTDWRMPTQNELAELYDSGKTSKNPPSSGCSGNYHITDLIHLTCGCPWASETRGSVAAIFHFQDGGRIWDLQSYGAYHRALPVRSGK